MDLSLVRSRLTTFKAYKRILWNCQQASSRYNCHRYWVYLEWYDIDLNTIVYLCWEKGFVSKRKNFIWAKFLYTWVFKLMHQYLWVFNFVSISKAKNRLVLTKLPRHSMSTSYIKMFYKHIWSYLFIFLFFSTLKIW